MGLRRARCTAALGDIPLLQLRQVRDHLMLQRLALRQESWKLIIRAPSQTNTAGTTPEPVSHQTEEIQATTRFLEMTTTQIAY